MKTKFARCQLQYEGCTMCCWMRFLGWVRPVATQRSQHFHNRPYSRPKVQMRLPWYCLPRSTSQHSVWHLKKKEKKKAGIVKNKSVHAMRERQQTEVKTEICGKEYINRNRKQILGKATLDVVWRALSQYGPVHCGPQAFIQGCVTKLVLHTFVYYL